MPDVPPWPEQSNLSTTPPTTLAGSPADSSTVGELRPVSVGQRIGSGLIDVVLVTLGGVVYTLLFGSDTGEVANTATFSMRLNDREVTGAGVWLFALLGLLYFFALELAVGGSVGKRLMGQRVVMDDGSKLTVGGAALRTLMRPIDGFPWILPNLLGFIVVAVNSKHRRIGDFLGRTMVVSTR